MEDSKTSLIDEFNERHAAVLLGGKFAILTEDTNPNSGHPEIRLSSVADIKRVYSNQKIMGVDDKGKPKLTNPVDIWMDHPDRRFYWGIVFIPSHAPDDYYNLFRGFFIEPVEGDCSLYLDHVFNNICSGNEGHYIWLLDWMADAIQNPGDRKGAAVVLRGGQGTGKGVFATNFGELFRPHFVHVSGQHRLTGKFNNHLNAMLLVFVDEGFWAGDRRDTGTLKAMITEKDMLVEPKFQDAYTVQNHMRVIMASNNDWVIPADLDERRFFVLDVANRNQKDTDYFKAVNQQMSNGGNQALMHLLSNRKIKSNLRKIPRTQALFDQMVESMDSIGRWWLACLQKEKVMDEDLWWPKYRLKDEVYKSYSDHCRKERERHPVTSSIFFKKLGKVCPGISSSRMDRGVGRQHYTLFPEIEICRDKFQKIINITINWDDDEVPF